MALFKAKGRQSFSVSRESEGADVYVKALRDGTLTIAGFFQALALEGRVFAGDGGGQATTSITAAGAYDADGADLVIDIPSGTTVFPLSIEWIVDTSTDDEDIEIVVYAANLANAVTTATAMIPYNVNFNSTNSSACDCDVACDAANSTDVTAATKIFTLYRTYMEYGAAPAAAQSEEGKELRFVWNAIQAGFSPPIIGAASITGHIMTTTAAKYFVNCKWAEVPSASIV